MCFDVLDVVISHLQAKLHVSLKVAVEKEGQE
jgi:hypothetical protein